MQCVLVPSIIIFHRNVSWPAVLRISPSLRGLTWAETEAEIVGDGVRKWQMEGKWERASGGFWIPRNQKRRQMERGSEGSLQSQTFHTYSLSPFSFLWFCFALTLCVKSIDVFPSKGFNIVFGGSLRNRGRGDGLFWPSVFLFNFVFVLFFVTSSSWQLDI